MNTPVSFTQQETVECCKSIGQNGFFDVTLNNIKSDFEISPDFKNVYIIKDSSKNMEFLKDSSFDNSYGLQKYKAWVYDGTETKETIGYKYIQMYPYEKPVLEEGDYICFDYYENGIKTTWIAIGLDSQSKFEQISGIKMCTNNLRFYNDEGMLINVPCVFTNKINSDKNVSLSNLKYINGITTVIAQLNSDSQQIKQNQRFLFGRPGNWVSFRVVSSGVNNFMNKVWNDNSTAKVLEITLEGSYVNELTDDLVNGIADAITPSIFLSQTELNGMAGENAKLYAKTFKNDEYYEYNILWSSSNDDIASVDQSGNVSFISDGSCLITATIDGTEISSSCNINVLDVPEQDFYISLSPYDENSYGILQGDMVNFECYLYNNGVKQDNEFTFSLETDIPSKNYEFSIINGNSFSIKNIEMFYGSSLNIKCDSGIYSKTFYILLNGAW